MHAHKMKDIHRQLLIKKFFRLFLKNIFGSKLGFKKLYPVFLIILICSLKISICMLVEGYLDSLNL